MELEKIRKFVHEHPEGVVIHMVNGTTYTIPHRDYITFGPLRETSKGEQVAAGTTFMVFEGPGLEYMKLVNAMLVAEVSVQKSGGKGKGRKRSA
jgi:hypothetical protein